MWRVQIVARRVALQNMNRYLPIPSTKHVKDIVVISVSKLVYSENMYIVI